MSDSGAAASNGGINDSASEDVKARELAANLAKAKEAGWNDRTAFQYEAVTSGAAPEDAGREDAPWLGNAAVYEWDDEYGDVGPKNEKLEKELYHDQDLQRAGIHLNSLEFEVDVIGSGPNKVAPIKNFEDAGLHPVMLENVKLCGYSAPTPIQAYTVPAVLTGHDVVGIAQTGSGKTAAYLLPILSKLMGKARILAAPRPNPVRYNRERDRVRAEPLVLVICPTRELACQIFDEARRLCYRTMLRPCVIYGGAPTKLQREQLEMGCDILIATPGRLTDFMSNLNLLSFNRLKFTVIDEADEMLDAGWELEKMIGGGDMNDDADHQFLMFSATFPPEFRKMAREFMEEDFICIKVGRVGSTHQNIKQTIVWVEESAKKQALFDLIMSGKPGRTLIFVNSKFKCDEIDDHLYNKGLPTTSIHSDRTQREREDALRAFRKAIAPIMVATGVTARGLDVANIVHVINYDLPSTQHGGITEYVHRIGRTARIGNVGKATSFYNDRNEDLAEDLVKILIESKQEIPDFLEDKKPENPDAIEWHDGTDDEADEADAGGFGDVGFGGGFGDTGFGGGADVGADADTGGFQADEGFKADTEDKMAAW